MTQTVTEEAPATQTATASVNGPVFPKRKVVVLLSGGVDSTVLLYERKRLNDEIVAAISFDYGQRHSCELTAATKVAEAAGVTHVVVPFPALAGLLPGSSLTDRSVPVPHGHYKDQTMKVTVVPNRNMILISVAAAIAISREACVVFYAAHGGDHTIYPDCREEFVAAVSAAVQAGNWGKIEVQAPYVKNAKASIVGWGDKMGVPFGLTWSCYDPQPADGPEELIHCGLCGTCVERREAFAYAGVKDPTIYKSR